MILSCSVKAEWACWHSGSRDRRDPAGALPLEASGRWEGKRALRLVRSPRRTVRPGLREGFCGRREDFGGRRAYF
jgi:hypothetical protein